MPPPPRRYPPRPTARGQARERTGTRHGFPLALHHALPSPWGGGGGRRPGGVGVCEYRLVRGGGVPPPRSPPPEAIPTTVPCPGEAGDTSRSPEPTWRFNRACTSPIANPERSAPMVAFAPMGGDPHLGPLPRGDSHHGPLYWDRPGKGWFYACSLSHSLMSVSYKIGSSPPAGAVTPVVSS